MSFLASLYPEVKEEVKVKVAEPKKKAPAKVKEVIKTVEPEVVKPKVSEVAKPLKKLEPLVEKKEEEPKKSKRLVKGSDESKLWAQEMALRRKIAKEQKMKEIVTVDEGK